MLRYQLITVLLLPILAVADGNPMTSYVLKFPESVKTVLVAETETATLHRYSVDEQGRVSGAAQRMSIGLNGVGKTRVGDQRTPLGVYFVVEELDTRNLHDKYGPVAFPLDYPNAWDHSRQRSGHGIWIHGVTPGSGQRPERDTDGCISLANDELLLLGPHLTPLHTPVIVTRRIQTMSETQLIADRDQLNGALQRWANSYRSGDWHRYLSLYTPDFVYRGMNRDEWSAYRLQTVGDRRIEDFMIDDVLLIADPEELGLYLSRFRQTITESGQTVATVKRLYWRKSAQGEFQIVAEDNG